MMNTKLTAAVSLLLATSSAACIDGDVLDFGSDDAVEIEESFGQTEQAIGSCTYRMPGAAITKQITSLSEPAQLLVEITTLTDRPYKLNVTSWTYPAGFRPISLKTTTCVESGATQWRCRHEGVIEQTTANSGTGQYSMNLTPVADAGSGCANGSNQRIDFSLTTETWSTYTVDAPGPEVMFYPHSYYVGAPFGMDIPYGSNQAYAQFIGNFLSFNDIASSVKVKPGYAVTIYETAYFSGRSITLTADHPWLGDGSLNFNDIASSAIVRRL